MSRVLNSEREPPPCLTHAWCSDVILRNAGPPDGSGWRTGTFGKSRTAFLAGIESVGRRASCFIRAARIPSDVRMLLPLRRDVGLLVRMSSNGLGLTPSRQILR